MKKNKIFLLSSFFSILILTDHTRAVLGSGMQLRSGRELPAPIVAPRLIAERPASPFINLPDEMLVKIFSYLDLKDLLQVARVDRLFRQMTSDPSIQREAIRKCDELLLYKLIFSAAKHGKEKIVRALLADQRVIRVVVDLALWWAAERGHNLVVLAILTDHRVTQVGILRALERADKMNHREAAETLRGWLEAHQ